MLNGLTDDYVLNQMASVQDYMWLHGWHLAAGNLDHWLNDTGTPHEMSPGALMTADPTFKKNVMASVAKGTAAGGSFDSGWSSGKIASDMEHGGSLEDYYYALNGYQYRVYGSHGQGGAEKVTVDLFKRYNWGNPAGGDGRNDLKALGGLVDLPQNQVAQLNADGMAWDYNVWGTYTYTIGGG